MDKLTPEECLVLADILGDFPTTVIPVSRLIEGTCDVYAIGKLSDFTAVLLIDTYCPEEPYAFGSDADALWQLLKANKEWNCINVDSVLAESLGNRMETEN